jgi:hypothetical protein
MSAYQHLSPDEQNRVADGLAAYTPVVGDLVDVDVPPAPPLSAADIAIREDAAAALEQWLAEQDGAA